MQLTHILLEYNRLNSIVANRQRLLDAFSTDISAIDFIYISSSESDDVKLNSLMSILEDIDPTDNKKYMRWIINQYINRNFLLEDSSQLSEDLLDYHTYKRFLPITDILKIKTVSELVNLLSEHEHNFRNIPTGKQQKKEIRDSIRQQSRILYDGELGILVVPETQESSCFWGQHSRWCTSANSNNRFNAYNTKGPIYLWIDRKTNKKYQFHWETLDFADESNTKLWDADIDTLTHYRTNHPVMSKLFKSKEQTLLKTDKIDVLIRYTKVVIRDRWHELENKLDNLPGKYYLNYLIALHDLNKITKNDKDLIDKVEKSIITDPRSAYIYLSYVKPNKMARWKEAEHYIMQDDEIAILYYDNIMDANWPEYKQHLLNQADLELRKTGKVNNVIPKIFLLLAKTGNRWAEAEPYIANAKDPDYIAEYAMDYLNTAWRNNSNIPFNIATVAEQNILQSDTFRIPVNYATFALRKRWPKLEQRMVRVINDNKFDTAQYMSDTYYIKDYLAEFKLTQEDLVKQYK